MGQKKYNAQDQNPKPHQPFEGEYKHYPYQDNVVSEAQSAYLKDTDWSFTSLSNLVSLESTSIISKIKKGLPIKIFDKLRAEFNVSTERMAEILGIPRSTLIRRKKAAVLDQSESERLVRFARLFTIATNLFEDKDAARTWLNSPALALNGKKPIDYADTEMGAREVEMLLGRIEHGVFT